MKINDFINKLKVYPIKTYLIIGYVVFFILGYSYVDKIMGQGLVSVSDKPKKEKAFEVKPVDITLKVINNGRELNTYVVRMQNTDSVLDLLDHLRNKKGFFYEKIGYTYGTDFDYINNIKAPEGYKWNLYIKDKNITYDANKTQLVDDEIFEFKLEKI